MINSSRAVRTFPLLLAASLLFLAAVSAPARARPGDGSGSLEKLRYSDLSGRVSDLDLPADPGVFGVAQAGTTFFGGTVWASDSLRWEAVQGQLWTFDTGIGSSIVGDVSFPYVNPFKLPGLHATMEGWVGWDNSYSEIPYFRRLSSADPRWQGAVCVGSAAGAPLGGSFSYWAGVFPAEASALCYAGGQGYGNNWVTCIEHPFTYTGGSVALTFGYRNDTEEDFDFTLVLVDTSGLGDDVEVASYTGTVAGSANLSLVQGIDLPVVVPAPLKIKFCVTSDLAWSDQDGLNATVCGAFAVDNIGVTGGGISHSATFETGNDGWILSPSSPGPGGEWSSLYHLDDLPLPLTPCTCALDDSVLAFPDDTNGHNRFADNLAASPWIDLEASGLVGASGKVIRTNIYAELPLLNYVFVQFNAQWYPEVCLNTGKLITSEGTSDGFVYFFGGIPNCTTVTSLLGAQIDFSAVIPSGAEQARIALGIIPYCRFFANCTQVSNTSPWFDHVGLGVYGVPGPPGIFANDIDRPQDIFPENGTLNLNATGRVDCNNVQGATQPEMGTTLGDTLIVRGGVGNAEIYVHFRVEPGPGMNASAFNAWYSQHAVSPVDAGFRVARCDTAERGNSGPLSGAWMTAYHESDPNFSGTDRDLDPSDVAPNGGTWRLANEIFPDDLFTAGSRIDLFYTATTWVRSRTAGIRSRPPSTRWRCCRRRRIPTGGGTASSTSITSTAGPSSSSRTR